MAEKVSRKEQFQYWLDNQFSGGIGILMAWLWILSLSLIFLIAGIVYLAGISPDGETTLSFWEIAWRSLMRSLDAGTMGADIGWQYRIAMFVVTIGGVFVISTLISVVTTGLSSKLDKLQKGRSRVLESNHTVILGWSEQVFTILNELMETNSKAGNACVVVMGNAEKPDMECEISKKVISKGKTRIVCRKGDPGQPTDLNLVNLNTARSIIVVSPGGDDPDSEIIKTILAVTNHPRRDKNRQMHIVAEITNQKNMDIARIIGKSEVEWIFASNFVARIIAQTSRQSSLSVVYSELLDFAGDEIYFHEEPRLVGQPYSQALLSFPGNSVMGICAANGIEKLNPHQDQTLQPGDKLILIARDSDCIVYRPRVPTAHTDPIEHSHQQPALPEQGLMLGWNKHAVQIVHELDQYVSPGSNLMIVSSQPCIKDDIARCCPDLKHLSIQTREGDTTDRHLLDSLDLTSIDHVILLAYSDSMNIQQADSKTLVTLLHLRDIATKTGCHFTLVSEMLDVRNRNLAAVTKADDFIVSDRLISLIMTQVSVNPHLNAVFNELLDPEGCEICLKAPGDYVRTGVETDFYAVVAAASQIGETALGYRLDREATDEDTMYGVHLNPCKDVMITFEPNDRIILLAES
jgi:voltage-gated potassium channel Kch